MHHKKFVVTSIICEDVIVLFSLNHSGEEDLSGGWFVYFLFRFLEFLILSCILRSCQQVIFVYVHFENFLFNGLRPLIAAHTFPYLVMLKIKFQH